LFAFFESILHRDPPQNLFSTVSVNRCYHTTATFRQADKDNQRTHHDALEFPNRQKVLLTDLLEGQEATVLQLPAQPVTAAETKGQKRIILAAVLILHDYSQSRR
jgi:hypothetical protein